MHVVAHGTVYDAFVASPEHRFCSFTALARLSDERLVVAFRTGSTKDSADEDVHIMLSEDQGVTWSSVCEGFGYTPPDSGGRIRSAGLT